MATYAIGDIQGCHGALLRLLDRVRFDPTEDHLWLVGDLINRGPDSLGVLRTLYTLRDRVHAVLGNHDLYALARHHGLCPATSDDTLAPLLDAPDRPALFDWLLNRPLLHENDTHLMVHAGLHPTWSLDTARTRATTAETHLRADPVAFLNALFTPDPALSPQNQVDRDTIRTLTRIRFVDTSGQPAPGSFSPESPQAAGLQPWFHAFQHTPHPPQKTLLFGHWAALGLYVAPPIVGLDSGCVWGGLLSAYRLEDGALFSVCAR